jgi:hypothetical protein
LTAAPATATVIAMTDPLALHRSLLTLDTHIDIPWPEGPAFRD